MTEPDPDGGGPLAAPVTNYAYGAEPTLLSQVTDPVGRDVTFQYDSRGRRTGVTDELGNQTTYTYNLLDLVTSVTAPDPDGGGPLTAPVTSYAYDYFQRLMSVTQPGGGLLNYTYDADGTPLTASGAADRLRPCHDHLAQMKPVPCTTPSIAGMPAGRSSTKRRISKRSHESSRKDWDGTRCGCWDTN